MVRTGLIALAVVLASSVAGCKSKSGDAAKKATEAEKPAAPEPQIPAGKVSVQLPTVHSDHARRVHRATAFVTIAKDGTLAQGKLAAGADPYVGKPHDPTKTFDEELFAGPPSPPDPPTQDDPPPPEPDDPDVAPARPQGQYKMKKPDDDAQLARQQAIDQARNAGILGAAAIDDDVYGGLLGGGGPPTFAYAQLDTKAGAVDVLVLADRDATARSAVLALDQLTAHTAALAVDGGDAPDALRFQFIRDPGRPEPPGAFVVFSEGNIHVTVDGSHDATIIPRSGTLDTAKLVSAFRASPMSPVTALVRVELDEKVTVQELADVLATLASVGAPRVQLESSDPSAMNGGFGYGRSGFGPGGGGTGWGTIGTGTGGSLGGGGTGYGVGSRSSGGSGPKVSIGQPSSVGDLDKAIIRRYIKRNIAKITYCYEKELLAKPDIKGTVKAQFFISPEGVVQSSTATGVDDAVASCVADVIQAIEFPKPKGGGGVQVNYPFTFRSTD